MSIHTRRRRDGRIVYDVRMRDPLGRAYKRTFATRKMAQDYEAAERVSRREGSWIDPHEGKARLSEYSTTWLASRPNLRIRTQELYEMQLRIHILPSLGDFEIASISSAVVRSWYASLFEKGLAQTTCA